MAYKFQGEASFPPAGDADEIPALKYKCEQLQDQLEKQTSELEEARLEIKRLKLQILKQSTFCASLGSVLGNLAWHASSPEIIDVWLSTNNLSKFLAIVNGSFVAFVNTYEEAFPPTDNVEYKFIIGLLGIVTNISASPEGREFLITNPNGKELVQRIIGLMPSFPASSGTVFLKRLILRILYNVSINKSGLEYLFEYRIGNMINYCLEDDSLLEELQLLCLCILQSITYDLSNPVHMESLTTSISIKKIKMIATSMHDEISTVAKDVIQNLQKSMNCINPNN